MTDKMPALFIGHGSPMNAIEDNEFNRYWRALAARLPKPRAILCVSAHWETRGVYLTAAESPETIHDFYGFPKALFDVHYPAAGDSALARHVAKLVQTPRVRLDGGRGLDHGAWSVLAQMYPQADVPVVQLSQDATQPPAFHYALGRELAPLRDEGVLILGSGNIVHNLGIMQFRNDKGYDWAERIDRTVQQKIGARDHAALIDYRGLDPQVTLAIPTPEHYMPLLYVLAAQGEDERAAIFNDRAVMGSITMTSVLIC